LKKLDNKKKLRLLVLYTSSDANGTFSYQGGWANAFLKNNQFKCIPCNLDGGGRIRGLQKSLTARIASVDAVILLHSVFSNAQMLRFPALEIIMSHPAPKVYFVGNEYKLMPEKLSFAKRMGISMLVTMNPDPRVQKMYENAIGCRVACLPSSGVDSQIFFPDKPIERRAIDIGYRADRSPFYLGHDERWEIANFFKRVAINLGLKVDISLDFKDRLDSLGWASFLNKCRGQIGTEAGGGYFELDDRTRIQVNDFTRKNPDADMPTIHDLFFKDYKDPLPNWMISGRHTEAAACKTVQILFEGRYNDYLKPDEHYIPLNKDFSNIDDVMQKFRDDDYCHRITENAYDLVMTELTYEKLIGKFSGHLISIL